MLLRFVIGLVPTIVLNIVMSTSDDFESLRRRFFEDRSHAGRTAVNARACRMADVLYAHWVDEFIKERPLKASQHQESLRFYGYLFKSWMMKEFGVAAAFKFFVVAVGSGYPENYDKE